MLIDAIAPAVSGLQAAPQRPHFHLQALVKAARSQGPLRVAVAYPCDAASLGAAIEAARIGLVIPVLVGPRARMESVAGQSGVDLSGVEWHETADDPRVAATQAAALCRDGTAAALMKGSLHTDELLAAAVARDAGLRTSRRASHAFVLDVPDFGRPLILTDCVVNIQPGLLEKRDIAQNAIGFAQAIGIARPHMAILSAIETVNPAIPSTLDAAALCKMADRGQITGAVLDGPLAFDNAVSMEAARTKGIVSPVAGDADILVTPDLDSGNMVAKQLEYLGDAQVAGLVMGARVPIVLTSRADSAHSRIASCALALLWLKHQATV